MRVASKTLAAIDTAIQKDQGAAFRQALQVLLPKMEDAYRGKDVPFRSHLGASLIGRDCTRELWYGFRWATIPEHEPRVLRLFNRGHLEEARFIAMLQIIGVEIWYETEDGGQFKFSDCHGHFGSSLDGVVRGIPDLPPNVAAYTEFKTAADKRFQKVVKNGCRNEKYEHFVQMQICMHEMNLPYSLYMMVNKNDDSLHAEIIEYDREVAIRYVDRASSIIFVDEAPPQINPSPGWWQCKFCNHAQVCKGSAVPEINCRTCAHSTPQQDGTWSCARGNDGIYREAVYTGCSEHVYNPHMLNKVIFHGGDANQNCIDITLPNGRRLLQGPNHVTSQELKDKGLK